MRPLLVLIPAFALLAGCSVHKHDHHGHGERHTDYRHVDHHRPRHDHGDRHDHRRHGHHHGHYRH